MGVVLKKTRPLCLSGVCYERELCSHTWLDSTASCAKTPQLSQQPDSAEWDFIRPWVGATQGMGRLLCSPQTTIVQNRDYKRGYYIPYEGLLVLGGTSQHGTFGPKSSSKSKGLATCLSELSDPTTPRSHLEVHLGLSPNRGTLLGVPIIRIIPIFGNPHLGSYEWGYK